MKNQLKKNSLFLLALGFLLAFTACQKNDGIVGSPTDIEVDADEARTNFENDPTFGYDKEIKDHVNGHSLNLNAIQKIDYLRPDGTTDKRLLIDDCIVVTEEELRDMLSQADKNRQYHTTNLVNPQTIHVVGKKSGNTGLSRKMKKGLKRAIANFNALNLDIDFTVSISNNTNNADIVVFKNGSQSGGATAGFPTAGGAPHDEISVNAGMNNYNLNVMEHVMTHELGHCVGLRHTDYFDRLSCSPPYQGNEGQAGIGAIHIPGTPAGTDVNSVMLACFSDDEDGEFGNFDQVALEYLY